VADQIVKLVSDTANTGPKVDTSELTVGANTVQRQRLVIADDTTSTAMAKVLDGQTAPALTDDALVVQLSPNSPVTLAKFRNLGTQQSIKAAAGVLFGLSILNNGVADCYIQVFNAAAGVTLGTEEPVLEYRVGAGQQMNVPIPSRGIAFGTGIRIASTTAEMGSAASAAGVMLFAQYA
jgi:hypothetical protein